MNKQDKQDNLILTIFIIHHKQWHVIINVTKGTLHSIGGYDYVYECLVYDKILKRLDEWFINKAKELLND